MDVLQVLMPSYVKEAEKLVTTKVVQEALDNMFVSVKLSTKQLQKLFKTLG